MATEQPSPAERKAPRRPPETSKNTGWWAAMIVISRDGAASELDRVFQVADRPNPNYRLQVHEGLREVQRLARARQRASDASPPLRPLHPSLPPRAQWEGFTLLHYTVWRCYSDGLRPRDAQGYLNALCSKGRVARLSRSAPPSRACVTRVFSPRRSADPSLADVLGRTPADMDLEMRCVPTLRLLRVPCPRTAKYAPRAPRWPRPDPGSGARVIDVSAHVALERAGLATRSARPIRWPRAPRFFSSPG